MPRDELLAAPVHWPRPSILDAPVTKLRGAGPKLSAVAAEALGVESLGDLLRHLPHSYREPAAVTPLADLKLGGAATIEVEVRSAHVRPTRRRGLTILEAKVSDASGTTTVTWFNQRWLADRLQPGTRILVQGSLGKRGFKATAHEIVGDKDTGLPAGIHTTGVVPVHPATERLKAQKVREWAWQAIGLSRNAIEPLPARMRRRREMPLAADALWAAHFPESPPQAEAARKRLAFEELLLYQVALAQRRERRQSGARGLGLGEKGEEVSRWLDSLPFRPTADQTAAMDEIDADLRAGETPMQRLLMGEVGSGKTVVALYAMLRAVEAGHQAALMAPTETLAEQHFATLEKLLDGVPLPAALLTGSTPAAARRDALSHLETGQLGLVVGTHALIEESVRLRSLAVAVVDEQHRFGVRQRAALDAKGPTHTPGAAPHVLHMTATPIPRTLSLTAYGDLDTTTLRELPAGRQPIVTKAVSKTQRPDAYEFIRKQLREGRQAFVVCPLVSESENLQARAATTEAKRLADGEFADFKVGVMHGQMHARDKATAMEAFASGEMDVLVATTVIEVGIDVPNATVIVIEEADMYGLSQLHQLRGRVGRGEHASVCLLFTDTEAGEAGETARSRIAAICEHSDGFELAEVDLKLRGEGEILGTQQHGMVRYKAAVLPDDIGLLMEAREAVQQWVREPGGLEAPELGPLLEAARSRWGDERQASVSA